MSTVGRLSSSAVRRAVLIGVVVFVSCLVGILSRQPGTLAVFWPANALLLGILFRSPRSATPLTWICAVAGYVGADLITGGAWESTVWLNAANVVGVASAFYAFRWVDGEDRRLTSIQSVGYLVSMTVVGASMAALVGGIANRVLFGGQWWDGWLLWFSSEFVNYMTIVPLVLTFPSLRRVDRDPKAVAALVRRSIVPTALLAVCIILEWVIGGAGAIAFAMPALVTAALLTNVFVTSMLTAVSTAWTLVLTADGHLGLSSEGLSPVSASVQIGLSLLAVAPIAVACVILERRRALEALTQAVTHDDLTGALRRDEFFRRGGGVTGATDPRRRSGRPVSVLMMDLDHFKLVNDNLGHRAGDTALVSFADQVRRNLDDKHLFARLGGEEFVVLMTGVDLEGATATAEMIRRAQAENSSAVLGDLGPTVSIGVACSPHGDADLTQLVDGADEALYEAKKLDRNRTVSLTLGEVT